MFNRVTRNAAYLCVRVLICLQLLLSSTVSYASQGDIDLASFLCSPSGQPLSPSAEAALTDLLKLLGEDSEETEPPNGHCDLCTVSNVAMLTPDQRLGDQPVSKQLPVFVAFETSLVHKAQGPPTGSRAPPYFI
jgi:hypothetical protein